MAEKLPLWRNVRWPQVAFGALFALLGHDLYLHATGARPLDGGGLALRVLGLFVLALVFVVYLQNVYRFGLVPDYSKKCRFCHGPVNRYSEFCEHCGADLVAVEKLVACPGCAIELVQGTRFCPECGTAVSKPKKGKKGHKKRREEEAAAAPAAAEGWDAPVDAVTGFPPEDERERR